MLYSFLLFPLFVFAKSLSLLTLNLHGYHPMDEERRVIMKSDGKWEIASSHLFYFSEVEIKRGHAKRQKELTGHFSKLRPDIVFLQEVVGAGFKSEKSCTNFLQDNTALELGRNLSGYKVWSSCRGNIGWWTDFTTFDHFQVFTENSGQLVMRRGDNPFPAGMIIEGLGILTSSKIEVISHQSVRVSTNDKGDSFFVQLLKFRPSRSASGWMLAANIHAGHMIQHFEQAVATRRYLSEFLKAQKDFNQFKGFIIAGDFNALHSLDEVSTVPWSFGHAWQTREGLKEALMRLNNSDYKPQLRLAWDEANRRINRSLEKLFDWFSWSRHPLDGSLFEVSHFSSCQLVSGSFNPFCHQKDKIDHIYVSDSSSIQQYSLLYQHHNWQDLAGTVSDHPGLYVEMRID